MATPKVAFHLEAVDANSANWLAFTAPVESGRLSMYAHRTQDIVRQILGFTASLPIFRRLVTPAGAHPGGDSISATEAFKVDANCSLDTVNNQPVAISASVKLHNSLTITGWVATGNNQSPAEFTLVLRGSETYGLKATTGVSRADVGRALHSDEAATSGFIIDALPGNMPAGTYQVIMKLEHDGQNETCDTKRAIVVNG